MNVRRTVRFYLNDVLVELDTIAPYQTLLDYLRLDRMMRGTKEGCAEGDCGACTVLVGRLDRDDHLVYETINACIRFVASLDGVHVVTIEHLAPQDAPLHPVQQAMVDNHGSQCGFCTPGFVMSLYGQWLQNPKPSVPEVEQALQGNLCRCTGYSSIIKAAQTISHYANPADDALMVHRAQTIERLRALRDGARIEIEAPGHRVISPASSDDLAVVLESYPQAVLIAGATDVGLWVTKFMRSLPVVVFLNRVADMQTVAIADGRIVLGAGVSFSDAAASLTEAIPQLEELWSRIGGVQIRNAGTVGGNIANGSPIGDSPPTLIALGARITLRMGASRRELPLEDYFIDYGKQDRQPGEFIETISVPIPDVGQEFRVYKVTKRFDEDISSVLGAFRLGIVDGRVADAVIAYGGMAATPKRAPSVEAALIGQPWTRDTVEAAMARYADDFKPLSDWRASAGYRMLVARNLLLRFFIETRGGTVTSGRDLIDG
ncbi:MAG: xanthine dehydrogenase [Devosia sp.]|uniref:xanthine dehydrogenase small subunit n=1 Tax=Devosia sp. TaxID=1871048 RepID=UPI002631ABE6|nr:xanthine dehydrogenase small subunit [Devosia sp.]MDB5531107.1 xanthine dehydrogenase [Devosia sp.]